MTWTGLERLSAQVLRCAVTLVMARLLAPADYGVVGMLGIFLAVAATFQDCGFTAALIQRKHCTHEDYCTAFYFNLGISIVLYLLLFVSSPWVATFYELPELAPIVRVIATSLVVQGLCAVHQAKLTIDLRFGVLATISIISLFATSACGICLAYLGYGVWALVWQSVLGAIFNMLACWCAAHWHPTWVFSVASFRGLFDFGSKLLCSTLINTIYQHIYTLVIGRKFTAADAGYYNRAIGFSDLPSSTLTGIILKVNYPILAQLQDDDPQLLLAYRRLLRTSMYVLTPVLFGMAVVAEPMVRVLVGDKWLPCVPYLQVLCLGMMWGPLTHLNLNLLYVKNRTDQVLKLELVKKSVAFLILFSLIPFGILWMCVGKAGYDFIAFCINCHYTKKMLGYGFAKQMQEMLPTLLNSLCMMMVAHLAMSMVGEAWMQLSLGIVAGVVSYLLGSVISHEESFFWILGLLKKRI